MRIISDFHDYYDTAQAFGQDPSCVYQRNYAKNKTSVRKSDIANIASTIMKDRWWKYGFGSTPVSQHILGFCGKIYPYLIVNNDPTGYVSPYWPKSKRKVFYIFSKEEYLLEMNRNNFLSPKLNSKKLKERKERVERVLKFFVEWDKSQTNTFEKYKVPIFQVNLDEMHTWTFTHNPHSEFHIHTNVNLGWVDFYKVKDAYQAFQEIEQFLSGVLALQQPEMVVISDKDMRDKKGFDNWSFKKLPGKKKPRKQKIAKS